jgi:hypothetical protein
MHGQKTPAVNYLDKTTHAEIYSTVLETAVLDLTHPENSQTHCLLFHPGNTLKKNTLSPNHVPQNTIFPIKSPD